METLTDILDQLNHQTQAFTNLLVDENDSLVSHSFEQTLALLDKKHALLGELSDAQRALTDWLSANGYETDASGLEKAVQHVSENGEPTLQTLWNSLRGQLRDCQSYTEQNARTSNMIRQNINLVLKRLALDTGVAQTYDATGHSSSLASRFQEKA